MAKELEKTLLVEDEEYNINAVEASKVEHSLKLKKNLLTTISEDSFDGQEEKIIDYVPASGGKFTGKIRVPTNTDNLTTEDVLNYGDLSERVLKELKNNSVLYEWTGTNLVGGGEGTDTIKSICIITGTEADVNNLAAYIYANKPFAAYVYIAETGSIYFGTCDSDTVTIVKVKADHAVTAERLVTARNFSVSLNSSDTVDFDGTNNAALGVSGTLPIDKGGTGASDLDSVTVGKAKSAENLAGYDDSGNYREISAAAAYVKFEQANSTNRVVSEITSGTRIVPKASNITTHTSAGNGATVYASYTNARVILSTAEPTSSDGANGDIWIKY